MTTQAETRFDHDRSTSVARLDLLRARLAVELARAGRPDLLSGIDDRWSVAATGPVRVVTVGETKRGKSTLVNTLVGRPLLSPVGVDVTTSCWLEVSYGDRDEAEVLLADSKSLGEPRIMPCELREVERYASLDDVTEPVVGVRVRVRSDLLRDMVLIDTPGVGGLVAGHSRTTLAALGRADALLFVCDARQPILEPEVRFLLEAAKRVPRVVVAITKCDANSNSEEVVSETRRRIAEQESLRDAPVFAVAAPLADLAHEIDDERASARLTQLSGIGPLVTTLTQQARAGGSAVRFSNAVAVAGNVARLLLRSAQEMATEMTGEVDRESAIAGEIARLGNLLNDGGRLALLAQHHMAQLRTGPVDMFDAQLSELEARFCAAAEHDPAAQLTTLAPRMVADVTAAGVAALEAAADQSMTLMRRLLDEIGAVGVIAEIPARDPSDFNVTVAAPTFSRSNVGAHVSDAAGVFTTLVQLLAGSAAVVAVLSGPGIVAASVALAAGAGWWRIRGDSEQRRRAALGAWVVASVQQTRSEFRREIGRRVSDVERYVGKVLPELLSTRRHELAALNDELARLRNGSERTRRDALSEQRVLISNLEQLVDESRALAAQAIGGHETVRSNG